jgi:polyhydroxyalkanoate synthesis regulator protein
MARLVPSYLDMSIETLAREQERFRKQMAETWGAAAGATPFGKSAFSGAPFGTAALEAMQEQTRQNIALFEKAMSLWSPFSGTQRGSEHAEPVANGKHEPAAVVSPASARESSPQSNNAELALLREQMAMMQRQLDKLSKGG